MTSRLFSNRRKAGVIALLVILGAAAGALCGALGVIPLAIQQAYWPNGDDGLIGSAVSWLPITMGVGATVGGLIGPLVSLTMLRSIALWRILVIATSAAIVGVFGSWAFLHFMRLPVPLRGLSPLWMPVTAAVVAAIWLRASSRRKVRDTTARADR
jgi:MFS family permease